MKNIKNFILESLVDFKIKDWQDFCAKYNCKMSKISNDEKESFYTVKHFTITISDNISNSIQTNMKKICSSRTIRKKYENEINKKYVEPCIEPRDVGLRKKEKEEIHFDYNNGATIYFNWNNYSITIDETNKMLIKWRSDLNYLKTETQLNKYHQVMANAINDIINYTHKTSNKTGNAKLAEFIINYANDQGYWYEDSPTFLENHRSKYIKALAQAIKNNPKDPEAIWDETKYNVWMNPNTDTDEELIKSEVIEYIKKYIK